MTQSVFRTELFEPGALGKERLTQELRDRARVHIAHRLLRNCRNQGEVLEAIREIATNLIGSEEVAVFKVDTRHAALWLYWSHGVDAAKYGVLDVFREPHLEEVLEGRILLHADGGGQPLLSTDDPVSALIPILADGSVVAVIVLFRVSGEKRTLDARDREICEVLSADAGRVVAAWRSQR